MTTRRRKTPKLKRRKEATAARRHSSSAADLKKHRERSRPHQGIGPRAPFPGCLLPRQDEAIGASTRAVVMPASGWRSHSPGMSRYRPATRDRRASLARVCLPAALRAAREFQQPRGIKSAAPLYSGCIFSEQALPQLGLIERGITATWSDRTRFLNAISGTRAP
jgi:hypothetical protein